VPVARGREILANLRGGISGTALPTYIFDRPGGLGKIPL
jgi:lysine 2,3-aminomutase